MQSAQPVEEDAQCLDEDEADNRERQSVVSSPAPSAASRLSGFYQVVIPDRDDNDIEDEADDDADDVAINLSEIDFEDSMNDFENELRLFQHVEERGN